MKRHSLRAGFVAATIVILLLPAYARADNLTVAPRSLSFGQIVVGNAGGAMEVEISTYFWAGISAIFTDGDFVQTNNCPAELPLYGSCRVMVTFKPSAAGLRTGLLVITSGANLFYVSLSGTGVGGADVNTDRHTDTHADTDIHAKSDIHADSDIHCNANSHTDPDAHSYTGFHGQRDGRVKPDLWRQY